MKLGLYLNTNKVGLQFGTEKDRDTFWNAMGSKANGGSDEPAEKFGQRSIRLHPEHFKARLMWTMDIETLSPEVVSPVVEVKVKPENVTAQAAVEPVAIIKEPEPVILPVPQPVPVPVPMQEVSAVPTASPAPFDPEPTDKRTKLWKDWAKRNKK